ncbi:MAG: efflux transporter outer membrane subunit [Janthinobacterium lividum]
MRAFMPPLRRLGAATLASLLAACTTVGPNYRVAAEAVVNRPQAAAQFAAAADRNFRSDALPPQWWRLYHDATLDGLIAKAFAANTDLRVAAANLERAQAAVREVEGAREPELALKAAPGYGRPSAVSLAQPAAFSDSYNYDVGAAVSYQVDLVGKITRAVEAASADAEAAQAAADLAHVMVAAHTAAAYVDNCATGQQIAVAQKSVDTQREFANLTQQRVTAGRGNVLETSRAQAQLEQLRSALPSLLAAHRVAQYRLSVLTGEVPGQLAPQLDACVAPPVLAQPIPVGDGAALLRRRPDIRQAERGVASASARIGVATAALYPSISLGLSVGSTGLVDEFGAGNAFRWGLGPLISWSLPSAGTHSRIAQAQAADVAAVARFDAAVLKALLETESALTTYARELDRNAALRAARDQSALASRQSAELYRYGRTDFLTTLDAERTLASAESALAASDGKLASDQVTLFMALGGGWEQEGAVQTAQPQSPERSAPPARHAD